MSMKNPLTPAGIEAATLRFVAQHLNYCATAVPSVTSNVSKFVALKSHLIQNHLICRGVGECQMTDEV